ncbi:ATPase domain-containing protein [Nitrososphaera sp.]|uniref:ATPase domain-containing protein n=1 Tax=Nitrososphaera sp. TaxID=1971748 RepID=UPI00307CF780
MTFERISTGIPGLDSLMEGGIPRGFTVLVAGNPGSGKTVLASHFLYEGLKNAGESGIYVSFSESREQFFNNVERLGMDFQKYEGEGKFHFLDLASVTREGIQDALDEVVATIRDSHAQRMVVDSFSAISQAFDDLNEARIALQIVLGKMTRAEGVTSMLIAEVPVGQESIGSGIEEFVADGIIKLEHGRTNAAPLGVRVIKMRGTDIDRETHLAVISSKGMTVYGKQKLRLSYPMSEERIRTGVPGLDERAGGGFLRGTTTAVIGASGVGKTTLSFQFVAEGVRAGEPGIFCSLEEAPDDIRRMARRYGYGDIESLEEAGLAIVSVVVENLHPDAFVSFLAEQIKKTGARRIAVDSISAFEQSYPDEMYSITKHLVALMREHGVTSIFTLLTTQQAGMNLTELGVSSLFQNIILLRYVEVEGAMRRSMLILKMRSTNHDESILEFTISDGSGMRIAGAMDEYTGILTGVAQRLYKEFEARKRAMAQEGAQKKEGRRRRSEFEASLGKKAGSSGSRQKGERGGGGRQQQQRRGRGQKR